MLDPKLLDPENNSRERYKFLSDNCVKLAQVLEEIPDAKHRQSGWVATNETCGTVCCALGWAVQTDILEGLNKYEYPLGVFRPEASWDRVGREYFGQHALSHIFYNLDRSRLATINALYTEAERLCQLAHEAPSDG